MKPSERIRQLYDEELAKLFRGGTMTEYSGLRCKVDAVIRYLDEQAEQGKPAGVTVLRPVKKDDG